MAPTTSSHTRRIPSAQHHRPAGPVRGIGAGGRRARLLFPVQPDPSGVPRSAPGEHRPGPQHHRSQHPHRELAQAIPVLAQELRSQQEELRESNEDLGRQARLLAEQNIDAEQKNQEIEQSKRLIEEKAGQLAVSSRYKSEFIANMSHELRRPLNSLLILAQQLEENPDHNMTDAQVEYASVIRASGTDLLTLLNSILDLAKVESGTVTVEMSDLSVGQLRSALFREFEPVAQGKGLGYSIDLASDSPEYIVTDAQRLHQILTNLLANAFKFTEHGEVQVRVHVASDGWNRETASLTTASSVLAVSVRDTGIGIEEGQQQRIFEAFAQGDGTTARLYGGTGLGLSISRELVGLLGGEITVISSPGHGSTFTVFLPLGRAATAACSMPAPRQSGSLVEANELAARHTGLRPEPSRSNRVDERAFAGMKVLVVDDDFRNIFALTALLERGHTDVTVAENGRDAIATVKRMPGIDIVLMDIMMPGMDGYATIRAIRTLDQCANLPIIAVTSKVMSGERERCIDAGANDYVPKPVDAAELFEVIRPWLPTIAHTTS